MNNKQISGNLTRREFLRLAGIGLAWSLFPAITGCVCDSSKKSNPVDPGTDGVVPSIELEKLMSFLSSGNASQTFVAIDGEKQRAVFHNTMRDTHVKCRYATTTETMALKFILDTLYGGILEDPSYPDMTYNYFSRYLWPHDLRSSSELPDASLNFLGAPTRSAPWLVQVRSSLFPQNNTLYEIYNEPEYGTDPISCVTLDGNGYPDFSVDAQWGGIDSNNHFRFGSAPDADQWMVLGYVLGTMLNGVDYNDDVTQSKKSLFQTLSSNGIYKNNMQFSGNWGGRIIDGSAANTWKTIGTDLYTAYQMPAVWYAMNESVVADSMVQFILDSQNAYSDLTGITGPYMPVFKDGNFTFTGADVNTHWMGFQYRTFRALAVYYAMTEDPAAKQSLDKFVVWVESNKAPVSGNLPYWIYSHQTDGAGINHNGGALGAIERWMFSPHEYALYAQGLSFIYAATEESSYKQKRDWALSEIINFQETNGSFLDPESLTWYGFHQTEVGIALALQTLENTLKQLKSFIVGYRSNFTQIVTTENPVFLDPIYIPQHEVSWYDFINNLLPENVTFSGGTIYMHGVTSAWWVGAMSTEYDKDLSAYRYIKFDALSGRAQLQIRIDGYDYQVPIDATEEPQSFTLDILTQFGISTEELADGVTIRLGLVAYDSADAEGKDISLMISVPSFQ